ncbi:unnamed protein product [Adineta steineri]|uniref:Translin-associated factor X-interacting protein 1 N-terminal domain-containing protein n=2 Tax=Adineta steineri TaxID=433720 RepID=A0A819Q4H1_9BILA|nr:unnamed protein product [Adineta steineri]CAF4018448.1 unnamed protein product [Adineta steineri]
MNIDLSDVKTNDNVPLTSRDRYFFNELNRYMTDESAKVGNDPSKQRFAVFRLAFEKVINKSSLYRPLFRAIKQEYERCIHVLESGADEVQTMSDDLHRLVLQPKTFLLQQKRCMELEDKLAIIEKENRKLEGEINEIVNETKTFEEELMKPFIEKNNNENNNTLQLRTGRRRIPGLTFAEQTDLKTLEKYYDFLRNKYSQFEENSVKNYTTKERRNEVQELFEEILSQLDKEREQRLTLRNRLRLYHLVWNIIKTYCTKEKKISINSVLLEDLIKKAIYESTDIFQKSEPDDEDEYNSESLYNREASILVDHIEIFINMIESGNYKEASYVAACSPKGVLRNMETLLKFKALKQPSNEDISPWLFHCKVLAETALEAPFKPDLIMSLECTKAACNENQLNLLYKWIVEDRLTCSFEMAQIVERLNALDLAEFIYRKLNAYYEVASCLLQAGSSKRCLDYLISIIDFNPNIKDTIIQLFNQYPSVKFAVDIVKTAPNGYLQADEIVLLFLQLDQHLNAMQFVEQLMQEKDTMCKTETDKLQTCFDILKKYSHLADNKGSSPEIVDEDSNANEAEFAHHLTRRITRSALDRLRRARRASNANNISLEPIEEHPALSPSLSPSPPPSQFSLCHEDFFNGFSSKLYFTDDVELKQDNLNE